MTRLLRLGLTAVLLLVPACDDSEVAGPIPGTLVVSLSSPYADDGALVLRLDGPDIGTVSLVDTGLYLHVVASGSSVTAVVVGDIAAGELLRFAVPDVGEAGDYAATVIQAADRSNALRGSLTGYAVGIEEADG